jgi:hypothetical protein
MFAWALEGSASPIAVEKFGGTELLNSNNECFENIYNCIVRDSDIQAGSAVCHVKFKSCMLAKQSSDNCF